MQYIWDIEHL